MRANSSALVFEAKAVSSPVRWRAGKSNLQSQPPEAGEWVLDRPQAPDCELLAPAGEEGTVPLVPDFREDTG